MSELESSELSQVGGGLDGAEAKAEGRRTTKDNGPDFSFDDDNKDVFVVEVGSRIRGPLTPS